MSKVVLICHISKKMKLEEAVKGTVLVKWNLGMGLFLENQGRAGVGGRGQVTHALHTEGITNNLKHSGFVYSVTGSQKGVKEGSPEHIETDGMIAEAKVQSSSLFTEGGWKGFVEKNDKNHMNLSRIMHQ